MALGVRVFKLDEQGRDQEVGSIRLVNGRLLPSARNPVLGQILSQPARGPRSGDRPVKGEEDPQAFLHNLRYQYRGAYLRCGAPEEIA